MIALTIDKVDAFVAKLQRKGVDVRWDGWTMVFHRPTKAAHRTNPESRYSRRTEEWGFETKVSPDEQGKWLVNYRLARGANA